MRVLMIVLLASAVAHAEGDEADAWKGQIHSRVDRLWAGSFLRDCQSLLQISHPLNNLALVTTLRLRVADDGRLASAKVEGASGVDDLDQSALEVARAAAPYPRPPEAALSDDGHAHVVWVFPRDPKNGGPAKGKVEIVAWPAPKAVPALLSQGRWRTALARLETHGQGEGASDLGRLIAAAVLRVGLAEKKARVTTIRAVGFGRVTALSQDLRLLVEGDPRLRAAAVQAAGRLGDRGSAPALLRLLPKLNPLSAKAATALAGLGDAASAWAVVEPKLKGGKKLAGLRTIADLGEPTSVAKLAEILEAKGSPAVRASAAIALGAAAGGTIGDATTALKKALLDKNPSVRAAAAAGLARAGKDGAISKGLFYKVIPVLVEDPKSNVRAAALVAVGATGRDRASVDVVLLSKKAKSLSMRIAAVEALGLIPTPEARERLFKMSASAAAKVRRAALLALARRHDVESLQFVAQADTKGLKLDDDQRMILATTRFQMSKTPIVDFAKGVREAEDAATRARLVGAWLASEAKR